MLEVNATLNRFQKAKQTRKINAAIIIQKWYRRYKAQRYVMHLICALVIQKWYRRYIAMKHYKQLRAAVRIQRAFRKWLLRMGFYTDQLKVGHGLLTKSSTISRSRGRRSLRAGASTRGSTRGDAWSMVSGEEDENQKELTTRKIMQLEKVYKEAMLDVKDVKSQIETNKADLEIEVDKWRVGYHSALATVRSLQNEVDKIKNSANQGNQSFSQNSLLVSNFVYPEDEDTEDSTSPHAFIPSTPSPTTPGRNYSSSSLDDSSANIFSQDQQAAIMALITGTTSDFLPIKPIAKTGHHFPASAWILFRSFIQIHRNWRPEALSTAADRLQINFKTEMQQACELEHCFYWWSVVLALSGILSVQSKSSVAQYGLSRVANTMLFVPAFHQALGRKVKEHLWKQVSIADLVQVRGSQDAWKQLSGNIEFIHDIMSKIKIPQSGICAVIRAMIQHVAAELLNALLKTPEYCSYGSLRAIQDGCRKVNTNIGGFFDEDDGSIFRNAWGPLTEAAQLILQGKDELIRLNDHAMDPIPALSRTCPSLSIQQVITLIQQGHDEREVQRQASVLRSKLDDLIRTLRKDDSFDQDEDEFDMKSQLLDTTKPFRFGCGNSEDDVEARKLVISAARTYANAGMEELGSAFEGIELPPVILQNATLRGMFVLRV
eukprot:TRINITY_DN2222_c1_g1_i1.p1 TRINITY_DN2222_c1_g1~~TRINITY_DN2222_c1_g1_i1.p1  ORF type:complete len:660 (-),score=86.76 TRINITY_DN2222_c1_g1_i1:313-2292(-)